MRTAPDLKSRPELQFTLRKPLGTLTHPLYEVEKRPSPAHDSKGANLHKILGGTAIILFLLVGRSNGQTRVLSLPQSTNSDRQGSASSSSNEPTIESKYKKQSKPKRDWCSLPDSKCLPQNTD